MNRFISATLLSLFGLPTVVNLVCCAKSQQDTTYVVTLFANEGTFGDSNQIVLSNIKPNTILQDVPGYREPIDPDFDHWVSGDTIFEKNFPITSNLLLNAVYNSEPVPISHKVTLFANGGSFADESSDFLYFDITDNETTLGEVIGNIKPEPVQYFDGWIDESGNKPDMDELITSDLFWIATYKTEPSKFWITLLNKPDEGYSIDKFETEGHQTLDIHIESKTPMNDDQIEFIQIGNKKIDDGFTFSLDDDNKKAATLTIIGEKIDDNICIQLHQPSVPVPLNFETDPWHVVAYYADQGQDALCKAYDHDASWFIGKTRLLNINYQLHEVVVIGTNHDIYFKDGVNNYAALTFQLKNVLCNYIDGTQLIIPWESDPSKYNSDYWSSTLENALNGDDPVAWRNTLNEVVPQDQQISFYHMVENGDPYNLWTQYIKTVTRYVCTNIGTIDFPIWTGYSVNVKFFLPTLSNLFSKIGIESSPLDDVVASEYYYLSEGQPDNTPIARIEDKQYEYYAQNDIQDNPLSKSNYFDSLIRWDMNQNSCSYWLPSPRIPSSHTVWFICDNNDNDGCCVNNCSIYEYQAIAPCFCI